MATIKNNGGDLELSAATTGDDIILSCNQVTAPSGTSHLDFGAAIKVHSSVNESGYHFNHITMAMEDVAEDLNLGATDTFTFLLHMGNIAGNNDSKRGPGNYSSGNVAVGVHTDKAIYAHNGLLIGSDRRIKKDIENVPDHLALQQVLDLPLKYYNYKEKFTPHKVIGFIAQEVEQIIPNAVKNVTNFIDDQNKYAKYSIVENGDEEIKIQITNFLPSLKENDKIQVRVIYDKNNSIAVESTVTNVHSSEKEDRLTGTIIIQKSSLQGIDIEGIFIKGKEVNDFKSLDKNQIFALHPGAIQELHDLITQQQKVIEDLSARLNVLESK